MFVEKVRKGEKRRNEQNEDETINKHTDLKEINTYQGFMQDFLLGEKYWVPFFFFLPCPLLAHAATGK